MNKIPFLSLSQALVIARIATAIFFMAHAIVRIMNGSIPQFGEFMEAKGFPNGVLVVWAITIIEIVAGTMLILNKCIRPSAFLLFAIDFVGIILIHRHNGWFVGEHGTGGSEYSVALIVLLLIIVAADNEKSK